MKHFFIPRDICIFLANFHQSSHYFIKFSGSTTFLRLTKNKKAKTREEATNFIISRPSGHVTSDFYGNFCDLLTRNYRIVFQKQQITGHLPQLHMNFVFSLPKDFALNFTFHFIHFSSDICYFANVTVEKSRNVAPDKFCFCGQHSKFDLYPVFNPVKTQVNTAHVKTFYNFNVTYLIFDADIAESVNIDTEKVSSLSFISTITIRKTKQLMHCFIEVLKIYQLVIDNFTADCFECSIFNGPGFLSPIINTTHRPVHLSSFCASLLFLMELQDMKARSIATYTTLIQRQTKRIIKQGTTAVLVWPADYCSHHFCGLVCETKSSTHVNLTVTSLNYKNKEMISCKYGGLQAMENGQDGLKEYPTLCEDHESEIQHNRSFYSVNSSLMSLLYWFSEYNAINATVLLSETKCNAIQICPCTFYFVCGRTHTLRGHNCQTYLREITKETNITFRHTHQANKLDPRFSWHSDYVLRYLVPENDCFTLQLVRNTAMLSNYSQPRGRTLFNDLAFSFICKLEIQSEPIQEPGNLVMITLKGSRKLDKCYPPHNRKCRTPIIPRDTKHIHFHGFARATSFQDTTRQEILYNPQHLSMKGSEFFLAFVLESPFRESSLQLELDEVFVANNWHEMTVVRMPQSKSPTQCLECLYIVQEPQVRLQKTNVSHNTENILFLF